VSVDRPYRGIAAGERRESRREALLQAALDCLGDELTPEGRDISVRSVCARARLTPRYFYESFHNLDELLAALVTRIGAELASGAQRELDARQPADLYGACRAAFEGAYAVISADPRKARAALVVASGAEALQEARRQIVLSYAEAMLSVLGHQLGDTAGTHQARLAVLYAVGGAFELMNAVLSGSVDITDDELADEVARLLASSLSQAGPQVQSRSS